MPGFVKTQKDEKKWNFAKKQSKSKGLKGRNFYAYANSIFHKMKNENNNSADYESFKKWLKNHSLLKPIKKAKFDTQKISFKDTSGKPLYPKKDSITVWGAPKDYNYIRN